MPALSDGEMAVRQLLFSTRRTTEALAELLGVENMTWEETVLSHQELSSSDRLSEQDVLIQTLLLSHSTTMTSLASCLSYSIPRSFANS